MRQTNDLKFREGRFSLIPYMELPAPIENYQENLDRANCTETTGKRALEAFLEKSFGVPVFVGGIDAGFSKTAYMP
jgi:hypothetical protein